MPTLRLISFSDVDYDNPSTNDLSDAFARLLRLVIVTILLAGTAVVVAWFVLFTEPPTQTATTTTVSTHSENSG